MACRGSDERRSGSLPCASGCATPSRRPSATPATASIRPSIARRTPTTRPTPRSRSRARCGAARATSRPALVERLPADDVIADGGGVGPGLHQPDAPGRAPRRAARPHAGGRAPRRRARGARPRPSSSTTRRPTSPRRCTSATCAARSSATPSCGCSTSQGHRVIRQNHVGDWGTPFGMLIEHLLDEQRRRTGQHACASWRRSTRPPARASTATRLRGARAPPRRAAPGRRRGRRSRSGGAWSTRRSSTSPRSTSSSASRCDPRTSPARAATTMRWPRVVAELERAGLARPSEGAHLRLPARLHRPRRRARAAHRAQAGRRLQLRHHRSRALCATARRRWAPGA